MTTEEATIIDTGNQEKDGQVKCPQCGSTDIATNVNTGKLRCNFCRHEFEPEKLVTNDNISDLIGTTLGSGAQDIIADTKDVVTLKCESCGAEVVIDTASSTQAHCHWCRNTLSLNNQIPNGAIPDALLPFSVTKADAKAQIEAFVGKRKFFAHPTFTREFNTDTINGVYFPYMIVDVNAHSTLSGTAEKLVREYTVTRNDKEETRYDADAYHVERDFDIAIDDLTVEASLDKLDVSNSEKTTNIINSIMPFDTENCVKYNANYLKGYTSEKRDVNINDITPLVEAQSADIARIAANDSLKQYDRGVAWHAENFEVKGTSWQAAYLPVWLYSYMQVKGQKKQLHYVAVNARTKETMGSVPINFTKLWIFSILIELFGGALAVLLSTVDSDNDWPWLLLLSGFAFFGVMYARYRNADARHTYEEETTRTVSNLTAVDRFIEHRYDLKNSNIDGKNNTTLYGSGDGSINDRILQNLKEKGLSSKTLQQMANRLDDDLK